MKVYEKYQEMNRAYDFISSVEGSNQINDRKLNLTRIDDALSFIRSLKNMNEFELINAEKAIAKAVDFLQSEEKYIVELVKEQKEAEELLSTQLDEARAIAKEEFEKVVKPAFSKIEKALMKARNTELPRTHKKDVFFSIKQAFDAEIKTITSLIG